MPIILAGTGYNQVITFNPEEKRKQKVVFGALNRQPVISIAQNPYSELIVYASAKHVWSVLNGQTKQLVQVNDKKNIISVNISSSSQRITYESANGSIHEAFYEQGQLSPFETIYQGQSHCSFVGTNHSLDESKCLFYGKSIVPCIVDKTNSLVCWRGKNVKHDELDLQVPINDVDGTFFKEDKFLAILNGNNKLRIYDIRGTHRRPVKDIELKAAPRTNMTKMTLGRDDNTIYVANSIGEIFQLDGRKDWTASKKFKGITTSVTGLTIKQDHLFTSSMDCYVRSFDLEDRSIVGKYYLNKSIYSLWVQSDGKEEKQKRVEQEFEEEEVNLEQEEEQQGGMTKKKVKQIRKRNKVGLKYLRPQQFDTPEEPEAKQQEVLKKQEWYEELNPIDRRQFEEQG